MKPTLTFRTALLLASLAALPAAAQRRCFAAAPAGAVTVRVGPGASRAAYRVDGPDDVRALLRGLR